MGRTHTVLKALRNGGEVLEIDTTEDGAKNTVKFTRPTISLYSTVACFVRLGDSDVTVAGTTGNHDKFIPAETVADLETGGYGYVAVIAGSDSGTVYINQWTSGSDTL